MNQTYKFKGGIWIGLWANSWPSGLLEFDQSSLILKDLLIRKEYEFTKDDIIKIEIKKYFPIFGYGIRIHHTNKKYNKRLYFWYAGFQFTKFLDALKKFHWLK